MFKKTQELSSEGEIEGEIIKMLNKSLLNSRYESLIKNNSS